MGVFDAQNLIWNDTTFGVAQASSPVVSDVLNLKQVAMEGGAPLELMAIVTEAAGSAGAADFTFTLYVDDAENMAGEKAVLATHTYALADLPAGTRIPFGMIVADPETTFNGTACQYLRCKCVIGTADANAGKITMGIVLDAQKGLIAPT